jgi:hypothetical protein
VTDILVTQQTVELVSDTTDVEVLATHLCAEVVGTPPVDVPIWATQLCVDIAGTNTVPGAVTQLNYEVLAGIACTLYDTQLALEVLLDDYTELTLESVYVDEDTFYAAAISVSLLVPLWSDVNTFNPVLCGRGLVLELWTNEPTYWTVLVSRELVASLFSAVTLYPSMAIAVTRFVELYTDADSFYTLNVMRSILVSLWRNTNTFSRLRLRVRHILWEPQLQTQADPTKAPKALYRLVQPIVPIWPVVVPYGTQTPYAIYTIISAEATLYLTGYAGTTQTFARIVVFDKTHRSALDLLHKAIAALQAATDIRLGGYTVQPSQWDPEAELYAASVELSLWHS